MRHNHVYRLVRETKTKAINTLTSLILVAASLGASLPAFVTSTANAAGIINISSVADLRNAIENQADGQTWNIAAGNYGLAPFNDITAGPGSPQTGWYFPITANNLTINGAGQGVTTIYGTGYSLNGNWSTQDLVAIFGDNDTINNMTLMPKVTPNKTVEVIGANATIENVTIEPNTLSMADYSSVADLSDRAWYEQWGGSLYFNHAGNHVVDNVTIKNGGISFRYSPSGTHVTFNGVVLDYATNDDFTNSYRYSSGFNDSGNSITGLPKVVYHINSTLNNLDSVLGAYQVTDTLSLDSDITTTKQITIDKDSVDLEGNNHTIYPNFAKTDNDNNAALGVIGANHVRINQLTIDGSGGTNLHGINVYESQDLQTWRVTTENNDHDGLVVGQGSWVQGVDLTTANNGWGGVDVDKPGSFFQSAGINHHNEGTHIPDIYVDDRSVGQVNDTNHQYTYIDNYLQSGDRAYFLAPAAPTNLQWLDGSNNPVTATNIDSITPSWSAPTTGAPVDHYMYSYSKDGGTTWSTPESIGNVTSLPNQAFGAAGTGTEGSWKFRLMSVTSNGLQSAWATSPAIMYDITKPSTPTITAPSQRQWFRTTPITDSWTGATDSLSGISHYQVAYNYDDGHSFSGSTCSGTAISGYSGFIGCRDVTGTSRDHTPGLNEEGGVTIWVRAIDNAGNVGPWSVPVHYYYDHTAPFTDIHVSSVVDGVFTVSGTATDNLALNRVYVQLVNTATSQRYGGTTINLITTPLSTSKSWSHTYDASGLGLPDGTYKANVEAVDMAGNTYNPGWTSGFVIDQTAPGIPTETLADANNNNVSDNGFISTQHFTFTLNNPSSDGVARYQLKYWNNITGSPFNGQSHAWSPTNLSGYTTNPADLSKYVDQFTQGEGTHYFAFSACDAANNCSAFSSPFTVTYDHTAPVAHITAPTGGSVLHGTVTVSGTVTDTNPDHYYFVVKNSHGTVVAGPGTVNQAVVASWSWDTTNTADGAYTIDLEARDKAGNKDSSSVDTLNVTVDNTAPILGAITVTINGNGTYSFSGTTSDPTSPLVIKLDGTTLGGVTLSGNTWSVTVPKPAAGQHGVTADSTDTSGNAATQQTAGFGVLGASTSATGTGNSNGSTPTTSAVTTSARTLAQQPSSTGSTGTAATTDTTPTTTATTDNTDSGQVKGASTDKQAASTVSGASKSAFLGLGWWWLLILAALAGFFWLIAGRRRNEDEDRS